jgi:hypothetical protein
MSARLRPESSSMDVTLNFNLFDGGGDEADDRRHRKEGTHQGVRGLSVRSSPWPLCLDHGALGRNLATAQLVGGEKFQASHVSAVSKGCGKCAWIYMILHRGRQLVLAASKDVVWHTASHVFTSQSTLFHLKQISSASL